MEWIYKALEQYTYITVRSIIFKFIALFAMFMTIHEQKDYVLYGGITILAASASNILNFINVHKYIDMRPVGGYNLRRHLKPVAIFFAMACASTIYTHLDTVMLGFMTTNTDVGYYNASVRIKSILISIVTSLGTVLLPRASYYIEHGEIEEFRRVSRKALNFVFLIACPLMIYFIIFARQGIYFLSNSAYEGAVVPMRIIMPTLLFVGITNITGIQMLVPMGKETVVLWSEIGGAVTDIILYAILIPKMASAGAAIGTLAAEMVVLIIQYAALRNEVAPSFKTVQYLKITAGIILASAASFWVVNLSLGSFVTLLISAVIFFAVYGCFLLVTGEPLTREIVITLCNDLRSRFRKR
jgi:O-antigen/teichoic acid export membrane protein